MSRLLVFGLDVPAAFAQAGMTPMERSVCGEYNDRAGLDAFYAAGEGR